MLIVLIASFVGKMPTFDGVRYRASYSAQEWYLSCSGLDQHYWGGQWWSSHVWGMVSRAVARGIATHNLPNWTRCGYLLHPQQCSGAKPYPRAETHNYSERNGGAGSSKLGAHAHHNYHIILFDPHNYHIIYHSYHITTISSSQLSHYPIGFTQLSHYLSHCHIIIAITAITFPLWPIQLSDYHHVISITFAL